MSQAANSSRLRSVLNPYWLFVVVAIVVVALMIVFQGQWLGFTRAFVDKGESANPPGEKSRGIASTDDAHAGHDHSHEGHDEGNSVELSEQARKNIGLKVAKVRLGPFTRTISVPGIVVERPGRSEVKVPAPMSGIVTRVYPTQGEAINLGQRLFDIRLTHEELVQAQSDLLRIAEELDVIGKEISRIQELTADGALPGKALLERRYEQQKQQAALRSQRQALLLHGMSNDQVDSILQTHTLLQSLTVVVPRATEPVSAEDMSFYQVQEVNVAQGQFVNIGDPLAVLTDHSQLYIEGNAFERDIPTINRAAAGKVPVGALVESGRGTPERIDDLRLLYADSIINTEERTLHFYVVLPNIVESDTKFADGRRFISWRFRPGQRMQLLIPVETFPNRIVLPADAVAQEGAETYVFTPNGNHFDRRPVHVEYKDQYTVVIANDGAIFPGSGVVVSGARQLQLQLKNQAGGGINPHAGHNH